MAFQNKTCLKEILHFHVRKQKMKELQRTNIHKKQKVFALKVLYLRGNYSKKILAQVRFYEKLSGIIKITEVILISFFE